MKKVLFVATVDSHIRHFHIPYLKYFKEKGYEVHVATANDENEKFDYCDKKHSISFERNPFKINNLKAIQQMKKLLREENFDIIHCHTPMGGVVTRIAAKKAKKNGTKVFYTAHGFHFYQGAPWKNWAIYYPVEKWLSRYTDVLITINQEDYEYAKKMKAKRVEKIDGIGVDSKRFQIQMSDNEKEEFRKELSNEKFKLGKNDIVLTYVAELIPRKNQELLINVMKEIVLKNPKIKLLLVGTGKLTETYKKQIEELGLEANVLLTGYRKDVPQIFKITDIGISTSRQEGLGLNLIESLLSGVPVIASRVRGHNEIVIDGKNGYMFESENRKDLIEKILKLAENTKLRNQMKLNAEKSVQRFILENSLKEGIEIYEKEDLNKIRIALYNSGVLPIPATKGGAVENLVMNVLNENEAEDSKYKFIVFSTFDKQAAEEGKKYKNTEFKFIKSNFIIDILDKLTFLFAKNILRKENSQTYRYIFKRLHYLNEVSKCLSKEIYDSILLENHTSQYLALKWRKNYLKYKGRYFYHCHNEIPGLYKCDAIVKNTKKFICVSEFMKKQMVQKIKLDESKFEVLRNCVDERKFDKVVTEEEKKKIKAKYKINENAKILIFTGRIVPEKGVEELLKALKEVKYENYKLLVVGGALYDLKTKTQYQSKIEKMVDELGDKVVFTGFINYEEIYKYYLIADVAVLPSIWNEPAGLTIIESMITKTPIITTKSGGIPEYAVSGAAIMLERDENLVENLAKEIDNILNDDKKREEMSLACEKAKAKLKVKGYYDDLIKLIN